MWSKAAVTLGSAICVLLLTLALGACGGSTANTPRPDDSRDSATPEISRTRLVPIASEAAEGANGGETGHDATKGSEATTGDRGGDGPSQIAAFGSGGSDTASYGAVLYYAGSATTTIEYLDPFGQSQGSYTYEMGAFVELKDPASAGGVVESNPINLLLAAGDPSGEGSIEIHSAIPFTDPTDGREVLAQYWNISASGSAVEGQLVDAHTAETLSVNFVNAAKEVAPGIPPMVWTYAMGTNTTLSGTIDANTASLRVEGNTIDGTRPFVSEIVANRQ